MVWSSLMAISGAVKREAWMKWADGKLFANLYAILVAPAGVTRKDTAIQFVIKMLRSLHSCIDDPNISGMKRLELFTERASPSALISSMVPENRDGSDIDFVYPDGRPMLNAEGEVIRYYQASEVSIVQSEMAATVGKQSFMDGIIEILLTLYDCHDHWGYRTEVRGREELYNIYATYFAATTPTAIKESLPTSTTGDGFLSRAVVIYQPYTEREFDEPILPDKAPSKKELQRRLAWIASHTFGEWTYTPEARAWFKDWYHEFKQQNAVDGLYMGVKSRFPTILRKLSMLIRWQRYDNTDQLVHLEDLMDAEHLLKRTFQSAIPVYRMIMSHDTNDRMLKVEEFIQKAGRVKRQGLQRNGHIPLEDVIAAVDVLLAEGRIEAYHEGKRVAVARHSKEEEYVWIGDEMDQELRLKKPIPQEIREENEADEYERVTKAGRGALYAAVQNQRGVLGQVIPGGLEHSEDSQAT